MEVTRFELAYFQYFQIAKRIIPPYTLCWEEVEEWKTSRWENLFKEPGLTLRRQSQKPGIPSKIFVLFL